MTFPQVLSCYLWVNRGREPGAMFIFVYAATPKTTVRELPGRGTHLRHKGQCSRYRTRLQRKRKGLVRRQGQDGALTKPAAPHPELGEWLSTRMKSSPGCPARQEEHLSHRLFNRSHWPSFKLKTGTSLFVQWLRLHAPNTGGPSSISGQGTRSHHAATKDPAGYN